MSSGILDDVLPCCRATGHCLACLFISNTATCVGDLWNVTCKRNLPRIILLTVTAIPDFLPRWSSKYRSGKGRVSYEGLEVKGGGKDLPFGSTWLA